jgi:hypothetical protein
MIECKEMSMEKFIFRAVLLHATKVCGRNGGADLLILNAG